MRKEAINWWDLSSLTSLAAGCTVFNDTLPLNTESDGSSTGGSSAGETTTEADVNTGWPGTTETPSTTEAVDTTSPPATTDTGASTGPPAESGEDRDGIDWQGATCESLAPPWAPPASSAAILGTGPSSTTSARQTGIDPVE